MAEQRSERQRHLVLRRSHYPRRGAGRGITGLGQRRTNTRHIPGSTLLDRDPVITIAGDPHDVVTRLSGIGPGHNDILSARPHRASQLGCHLFVQQTPLSTALDKFSGIVYIDT